jgi:D-threo-aldose 1-dehydrogenase
MTDRSIAGLPPLATPLAFGTAPLSTQFWENEQATAVDAAVAAIDAGITWFDTAPLYGSGEAEERLGAALHRRADPAGLIVATKVGRPVVDGPSGRESIFDYSRDATLASLEASLGRLGRDHVDVVHVHDPDDHLREALDLCLPTLVQLRAEGVITAISVGTMVCSTALTLLAESDLDLVMIANRLTLLDHSALGELVPACAGRGVPMVAAAVFNSGLLASQRPGVWFDYAPASADLVARAQRAADICAAHGVPLRAAALQFPLRFPPVAAVVAGMATAAQVAENVHLMTLSIPESLWDELDDQQP